MIDPNCYVEIPADKLRDAVKLAYEYSSPRGMGFLHAKSGGLDDESVEAIVGRSGSVDWIAANMDYVHGRCCKFGVYRHEDRLFVKPRWYDHSDHDLIELLTEIGVDAPADKIAAAIEAQRLANEKFDRENA